MLDKNTIIFASLYKQDVFEDGSGLRRQNFPDGLWGGYLRFTDKPRLLQAIVYEFLGTKDQSGLKHNDPDGNNFGMMFHVHKELILYEINK